MRVPDNVQDTKCQTAEDCVQQIKKSHIPTLYRLCIRIITRNIEQCTCDDWDLSQLPSTIKTDLLQLNMKLSIGFQNENAFIQLLTPNVTQLMFRSCVVTDAMLQCVSERCNYLQELRIFDSNQNDKKFSISSEGLLDCIKGLRSVKFLQISESDKVNDQTIEMISRNCPRLQSLSLNDCKFVTDNCSESIKSMRLNDLNFANTSITDKWIFELINSTLMDNLRDISLKNCKISNDGLQRLNWKRLQNINIIGVKIRDLSFIPPTAKYKTLNWSV